MSEEAPPSKPDAAAEADSLWQRWTGETGPFYRSCAVLGFDTFSDDDIEAAADVERPDLRFCTGLVRLGLRHIPALVLFMTIAAFTIGQLNDFYIPLGTHLPLELASPTLQPVYLLGLPVIIVWGALLVSLFSGAVSTDDLRLHRSVCFYGTLALLVAGVAYSTYLVVADRLTQPRQHLAFRSGYFLFLFLEGHLAYDGLVLRGENLFWNLADNEIVDADAYADFRDRLTENLAPIEFGPLSLGPLSVGRVRISRGLLFAVVLLLPTIPLPLLAYQTSHPLLGRLGYSITVVLQIFLVAVLFHFAVLLWQFSELLSGDYLDYKPFHPDEHGGYRVLGRFATRVNLMLVVAGGYVAFRFLTGGLRQFQATANDSTLGLLTWGISFVGPFVVYLAIVVLWLYFSFWRMHRQMQRGRRRKIQRLQERARDGPDESVRSDSVMEDLELDAPAWESLQGAPVWPIRRRSLVGIAALDAVPLLVTMVI